MCGTTTTISLAPPTLYLPFLLGGGGRKGSGKRSTDDLSPTNGYYVIPIFTRIYIELERASWVEHRVASGLCTDLASSVFSPIAATTIDQSLSEWPVVVGLFAWLVLSQ